MHAEPSRSDTLHARITRRGGFHLCAICAERSLVLQPNPTQSEFYELSRVSCQFSAASTLRAHQPTSNFLVLIRIRVLQCVRRTDGQVTGSAPRGDDDLTELSAEPCRRAYRGALPCRAPECAHADDCCSRALGLVKHRHGVACMAWPWRLGPTTARFCGVSRSSAGTLAIWLRWHAWHGL